MSGLILGVSLVAAIAIPAHAQEACADVNKDTVVNSIDATLILQLDAGIYDPGLILLNQWDPFDDDMITSRDALLVLQYDAGLLAELNCYGP